MNRYKYRDGLESERLKTRFLQLADVDVWEEFYTREENSKYLLNLGGSTPKENARLAVERQLKRYKQKTYGLQALIEKSSGQLIGQCGVLSQDVNGRLELEVGYQLFNNYWGMGYATEAAQLFRDYGFKELSAESIISIIDVENLPSQRVAERNGMKCAEQIKYMGFDVFVYRITKPEWEKL
ncbi:GNAT family N-acetyltransferase [Reichenbachiella ulvae]|uniref:GNAT family N-acetyltransferase n=1 Tax=Reichenbachiella ulvae TaxID=2980104 RepID=A0ABT3CYR4_9BACT|nr:GNAT family N-acetyltransferase [Reichenbachiella ulvae]MCV9388711.1 GNAT family N-acetyltransferase [Reichenbachiella ulvae]